MDLHDKTDARGFYEERYESGYMQEWPPDKLRRVEAVVRALPLPTTGRFLDFGCGTGVFTEVLMRALPGWSAHGTEIVSNALSRAASRCPGARFSGIEEVSGTFDLVFSHHVLEHVSNLDETMGLVARHCADGGTVLHIMPCGNEGSLEQRICAAVRNGIEPDKGNRFFFEDDGHLRRLTSAQLRAAFARHGFEVSHELFANHYYGALLLLSEQTPDWIRTTLDPARAADAAGARFIADVRKKLLRLRLFRRPPSLLFKGAEWRLSKAHLGWREYLALVAGNPLTLTCGVADRWIRRREENEWSERRTDPSGSEMFIAARRSTAGAQVPSARSFRI
jgi:trans-aconitate methyltransferase